MISYHRKQVSQYIAYVASMWVGSQSYIVNLFLENVFNFVSTRSESMLIGKVFIAALSAKF